jgi:cytochrome c biogenesis protein CcmG/thiol:disulfide interchange protein DsbE
MDLGVGLSIVIFASGLFGNATQAADCEPSRETRQALKHLEELTGAKLAEKQKALLEKMITQQPDDVFLHLRYQQVVNETDPERTGLIERYKDIAEKHHGDTEFSVLYAKAFVDANTPEAISQLKQVSSSAPDYPLTHLLLADIYSWGKFADHREMRTQLESFYTGCPASMNDLARDLLEGNATPEMAAKYSTPLRARLMKEADPENLTAWRTVWNLEFKAAPPAEHERIRKQLAADMVRLQKNAQRKDLNWLTTLQAGYKMLGDENARRRIEDRIAAEYPEAYEARAIVRTRWSKQHPAPKPSDSDESRQDYYRVELQAAEERLKVTPNDLESMSMRWDALNNLKDVDVTRLVAAGEAMRKASQNNLGWYSMPPFEFQIAKAYLKRKTHASEIPGLIKEGWTSYGVPGTAATSDRETDEVKKNRNESRLFMNIEAAGILLGAAEQLKQPELAKSTVEALADAKPEQPDEQSSLWMVKAKWADLNGRKLDALLMYRAALYARPRDLQPPAGEPNEIAENCDRLWKELGGTAEGENLWARKENGAEASSADGEWEKPAKELPAWQLPDLDGKTWKLVSLQGKTVLINVWASWCGPCRAEHPYLQKLYEKTRGRSDIQIVTFDVDDELGGVAPYMKENKYTFPVLLAKDYVNDLLPLISIPRNWVIDATGKWQWEQIGFGSPESWEDAVLEKLGKARPE